MSVFDLLQEIVQDRELALAVDKYCRARQRGLAEPGPAMRNTEQAISRDRLGFAFQGERAHGLDASVVLRRQAGRLAQQDRSRLGRLVKSGGDIGGIAD